MKRIIVGIETSCDDTTVGIISVDENFSYKILSDRRYTQNKENTEYGGVVPEIAARRHFMDISRTFKEALSEAKISVNDISVISATVGPGLIGSLTIGFYFAKYLAALQNITFIPIHHLEGHIDILNVKKYPCLVLLISGGHSMIIKAMSMYDTEIIINTCDDAFGELFDKIGRCYNMKIPSGKYIEQEALKCKHNIDKKDIVIAMPNKLAFSCSGLKTKFIKMIDKKEYKKEYICKLLQETVAQNLLHKVKLAQKKTGILNVIVAGGVSANQRIRKVLNFASFAPINLCTDNGVMIAVAALKHVQNNTNRVNNMCLNTSSNIDLSKFLRDDLSKNQYY